MRSGFISVCKGGLICGAAYTAEAAKAVGIRNQEDAGLTSETCALTVHPASHELMQTVASTRNTNITTIRWKMVDGVAEKL